MSRDGKWSKPARENPYIALLGLTFSDLSAPLKSQYAQVLQYAHRIDIAPGDFIDWLENGHGIKGRLEEATDLTNSTARQINARAKMSRLENARSFLATAPRSAAVALPLPVQHKGFATVLVEIDGDNNASILSVLDTDDSKIDPILLKLVPNKGVLRDTLAARPLGRLHRAVDMILSMVDAGGLKNAYIWISNQTGNGDAVTQVRVIAEDYSYAWAGMTLDGHIPELPVGEPLLLNMADAQIFRTDFVQHEDWAIGAANVGTTGYALSATKPLPIELPLLPLPSEPQLRGISKTPIYPHPATVEQQAAKSILEFIECWRDDIRRANSQRKIAEPLPRRLGLSITGHECQISRDDMPQIATNLMSHMPSCVFAEPRWLAVNDVERVCQTLDTYETGATGWITHEDVPQAALRLRTEFPTANGHDVLHVVIPTVVSNGMHYAQTCGDIAR